MVTTVNFKNQNAPTDVEPVTVVCDDLIEGTMMFDMFKGMARVTQPVEVTLIHDGKTEQHTVIKP